MIKMIIVKNACESERHNHATSSSSFWKILHMWIFSSLRKLFFRDKKKAIFVSFEVVLEMMDEIFDLIIC